MDKAKSTDITFCEFYKTWLKNHRMYVEENTHNSYVWLAKAHILPYFDKEGILLQDLTYDDLENYYTSKIFEGLSVNSIRHLHANIHSSLNLAVRKGLISFNPATGAKLPPKKKYIAKYYSIDELNQCLSAFKGHQLETSVLLASLLGLRRSEVLGLTWENVNLSARTVSIVKTVVSTLDAKSGKTIQINKSKTKSERSLRTLVLPERLYLHLKDIDKRRKNGSFEDNVVLNSENLPFKPDYVTRNFKRHLVASGLRPIRFHDLRHSCATMLLSLNYNLKDIQMWLGHSDIQTTANIYMHYSIENKEKIATGIDVCIK